MTQRSLIFSFSLALCASLAPAQQITPPTAASVVAAPGQAMPRLGTAPTRVAALPIGTPELAVPPTVMPGRSEGNPQQSQSVPAQLPLAEPQAQGQPTGPAVLDFADLREQARGLIVKAQAGSGSAGITLARYPDHYTMLTARTRSGGAELHKHFADFLFVLEGSGIELTGGTIVQPTEAPNQPAPGGEVHGLRLDNATPHALKAGDVIHIPAGTPHQAIEQPGQSITIFVIKVEEPADVVSAQ